VPALAETVDRALTVLACVAAQPRATGVVFLDLDPELLPALGDWLAAHLSQGESITRESRPMPPVRALGSWLGEDDLWLRTLLSSDGLRVLPGLLVEESAAPPPVLLVPDLCRAGPAVVRAALAVLDTDAASAERHGHSMLWRPGAHWLAALRRSEASRLSPHLLDRFPVRVDAARLNGELWRLAHEWGVGTGVGARAGDSDIGRYVGTNSRADGDRSRGRGGGRDMFGSAAADGSANGLRPAEDPYRTQAPPDGWSERAALGAVLPRLDRTEGGRLPVLAPEAARQVAALTARTPGLRRSLTLARLARALAARAHAAVVGPRHVTDAAELLGIVAPRRHDLEPPELPEPPAVAPPAPAPVSSRTDGTDTVPTPDAVAAPITVAGSGPARSMDPVEAAGAVGPAVSGYPEDDPDALPQLASLRPPGHRRTSARRLHGCPLGTVRARDVHDLALVASLVEAARFQTVRRRETDHAPGTLVVRPEDLRQYRRKAEPAQALVLVLDHSCHGDVDWAPALAPHLRWAYETNAAVSVVEFGHTGAASELCAERFRASSLLDPEVVEALQRRPGLASPLAHAFDLAAHEVRRFLRRGRGVVDETALVVVTDGRGNVPLDASLRGRVPTRVRREGLDDALRIAGTIRALGRVRAYVVAPETDQYPELPGELADALGARQEIVPERNGDRGAGE